MPAYIREPIGGGRGEPIWGQGIDWPQYACSHGEISPRLGRQPSGLLLWIRNRIPRPLL